jgi:hypothetical protein
MDEEYDYSFTDDAERRSPGKRSNMPALAVVHQCGGYFRPFSHIKQQRDGDLFRDKKDLEAHCLATMTSKSPPSVKEGGDELATCMQWPHVRAQ